MQEGPTIITKHICITRMAGKTVKSNIVDMYGCVAGVLCVNKEDLELKQKDSPARIRTSDA